jgi:hypothetical protein
MLSKVPALQFLTAEQLDEVHKNAKSLDFKAGEDIIKVGENGTSLFILERGDCHATGTVEAPAKSAGELNTFLGCNMFMSLLPWHSLYSWRIVRLVRRG